MYVVDPRPNFIENFSSDEVLAIIYALELKRDKLIADTAESGGVALYAEYPAFLTALAEKFKNISTEF
jgi:hypothetical protein